MNAKEKIEEFKETTNGYLEAAKEAVCDICVWPHKETDQEAMTARCDACMVMAALDQLAEKNHIIWHAAGMIEAFAMLVESTDRALEEQHLEWMERLRAATKGEVFV